MNVKQENLADLHIALHIEITTEDYLPKFEQALKNMAQKAQMKGFRPGKVPKGLVKKMYGEQLLAEELNKLVQEQLKDYIQTNEINYLGDPIPHDDERITIQVDPPVDYTFSFELGISPKIDLPFLSAETSVDRYLITVPEEAIDDEIQRIRLQFGVMQETEEVGEKDLLQLILTPDEAAPMAGSAMEPKKVPMNMSQIKDEAMTAAFIGKKKGDKVLIEDITKMLDKSAEDVGRFIFDLEHEEAGSIAIRYQAEIAGIERMSEAALDQALFDKAFGEGVITSEEDLRNKIREEIEKIYRKDTEQYLSNTLAEKLLDATHIAFPEVFLRKWLEMTKEEKDDKEVDDKEFSDFKRGLKWMLVKRKIVEDNKLEVSQEDLLGRTKEMIAGYFGGQMGGAEQMEGLVSHFMQNKEHVDKTAESLINDKVFETIKELVTVTDKKVNLEEFKKLVSEEKHEHTEV